MASDSPVPSNFPFGFVVCISAVDLTVPDQIAQLLRLSV